MGLPTTASQTIGPFFAILLPLGSNELISPGAAGAIRLTGHVFDGAGVVVPDAMIELWQADEAGRYPEGGATSDFRGFGRCMTGADGGYSFVTVKPGRVPGWDERVQAPHLSLGIFARGVLKRLATRLYFPDEPAANASDPVLAAIGDDSIRRTLVASEVGPHRYQFDIHLQGDSETAFFAI
jgi:protocatechuate 3,4-dioxygenase alpha subunit